MKKLPLLAALCLMTTMAQALPPAIEADKLLLEIKALRDQSQYAPMLEKFERIASLGVSVDDTFYYHWGVALLNAPTGSPELALAKFDKYLADSGSSGKFYREALESYSAAEKKNNELKSLEEKRASELRALEEKRARDLKAQEEKRARDLKEQEEKRVRDLKEQEEKRARDLKAQEEKRVLELKAQAAAEELKEKLKALNDKSPIGQTLKDCKKSCPEMVIIPAGSYQMGSTDHSNEKPVHQVTIGYILAVGKYEVTYDEWDACVSDGGCNGYHPEGGGFFRGAIWYRDTQPVSYISWEDAQSYVEWLSRKTGQAYRLLSESEWEYVARAGTTTLYSWGDEVGSNRASCNGCGSQWDNKQAAPVGSFAANGFGLFDVHGNVWEWVEDCYQAGYRGSPVDGSARSSCTGSDSGMRVLRGGSWNYSPVNLHSANRLGYSSSNRLSYIGFRVARRL